MRNGIVLVIVLTLGCNKTTSSDAEAGSGSANAVTSTPSATTIAAPVASTAPATGRLTCDKLVPTAVRDKYMAGMKLKESGSPTSTTHSCDFEDPKEMFKQVFTSYTCGRKVDDAGMKLALETVKGTDPKGKTGKDIPNLGRGAVEVKAMGATWQIHVYDDKTPCSVVVGFGLTPPDNRVDIARGILAALTPESIQ
jgi:hypothetical protein